jgi:cell division protein FtsB
MDPSIKPKNVGRVTRLNSKNSDQTERESEENDLQAQSSIDSAITSAAAISDQLSVISSSLPSKVDAGFESMNTAIRMILTTLQEMTTALQAQAQANSDLLKEGKLQTAKLDTVISELNHCKKENEELKEEIQTLNSKLNDQEQYSKNYNLEFQGVPEHPGENVYHIVTDIARYLGCNITPDNIELCHRMRKSEKAAGKPANIIAKFYSRQIKESIISGRKNNRFVKAGDIGILNSENKIFVNEHLTRINRNLYWLARNTRQIGYKYAWTKSGKIFLRKDDSSRIIRVLSAADIPTE